MILTTESVDEILWCDHSNETSPAVLSHGANLYLSFLQNEIRDLSWILILGTLGSERVKLRPSFVLISLLRFTNTTDVFSSPPPALLTNSLQDNDC